ncbi:hypothetical protein WN943_003992 [Citrus x changshan-huyou]
MIRHMISRSVQPMPYDVTPLPQLMKTDSQALVAVPAVAMEALAIVPFHKKSKHHEIVWRQTRRPFFVLEIEALVQAVEKLGTERSVSCLPFHFI